MELTTLYFPPNVPRSPILPDFHRTARNSLTPKSGSTIPFSDCPTISPRAFTDVAMLQLLSPASAPKSVTLPACHLNAWKMNGTMPSTPPQTPVLLSGVNGMEVADEPTATPLAFIWLGAPSAAGLLIKLAGPPKVPRSMSL